MTAKEEPWAPVLIDLIEKPDYLESCTVVQHAYRQVRVIGTDVIDGPFDYELDDAIHDLELRLASASGNRPDNHVTYEVTGPEGIFYLWFHDLSLAFGKATRPY